jgi:hypothetical protein
MLGRGIVHLHSAVVVIVIVVDNDGTAVVSRIGDVRVEHAVNESAALVCLVEVRRERINTQKLDGDSDIRGDMVCP